MSFKNTVYSYNPHNWRSDEQFKNETEETTDTTTLRKAPKKVIKRANSHMETGGGYFQLLLLSLNIQATCQLYANCIVHFFIYNMLYFGKGLCDFLTTPYN